MAEKTPAPAAPPAKRIQLVNNTRDVLHIPVEKPPACVRAGDTFLVLGDKADTNDKVPESGRNEGLQPNPVRVLTAAEYDGLGAFAHTIIDDQVAQGRVSRTELAA